MESIIKGEPKEIADLVAEIQSRQSDDYIVEVTEQASNKLAESISSKEHLGWS
ncbi:MAG: hypothetical protein ACI4HN_04710 [Ruminococcus sp.]